MTMLIAASFAFLAIHFFVSGTRLRDRLTTSIGEGPYRGLFVVASFATIGWLAFAYNRAALSPDNVVLYDFGAGIRHMAIPVVALAFLLGVQGLFEKNPTAVQGETMTGDMPVHGVTRITRHPFLWGVVLWSGFHTAANGDIASMIFFGTFFILALLGTASIDAKRKRKMGAAWDAFANKTSNLPFAAIAAGRNHFSAAEFFGWRFWAAAGIFVAVLFAHAWLFSASPFPTGWVPFA